MKPGWVRPWTKPGKIRGERGKPNVVQRILNLICDWENAHYSSPPEISMSRLHRLAYRKDPALLQKQRLYWGAHFAMKAGHLKRISRGRYRIRY